MEFKILGPLEVVADDGRPIPIDRRSHRELMLVLLLLSSQPASSDRLITALWGESAVARHQALRTRIHDLRRTLGDDHDRLPPGGRQLRVLPGELDSETFRSLARHGQQALELGDHGGAARLLQQAASLWREPVWENPRVPSSLASVASELDELRKDCRDALIDARLALGQYTEVIAPLRDVIRDEPYCEHAYGQLMLAQYGSGQTADALRTYSQARTALATQLGLDPGPELEVLHRQVLAGDAEPLTHVRSSSAPSAAAAAQAGMYQLPAAPADFTGRGAEVGVLQHRLATSAMTITVISGPIGTGKTALALYAAHQAHDLFPDGQLFARLGGPGRPRDPQDVLEEALHALGISAERIPPAGPEREALYRAVLAHRRVLLIADDATTAAQVRPLLPGTDGSAVLVTSRSRLAGLEAAQLVDLGELPAGEAAALLGAISGPGCAFPDDDALAAIASRCGYLPLALRVAGSRLAFEPGLTPRGLAQALRSQQHRLAELAIADVSVIAQLEAAYHALGEQDRRVFRLASVHPADIPGWLVGGSAVPIAAAGLLTEVPAPGEAGPWYRIHHLTRLYAETRLAAEDPPEAVMAHKRRMLTSWLEIATHADCQLPRHAYLPPPAALALPMVAPAAECAAAAADAAGWLARHHATLIALTKQACPVDLSLAAALGDCQFGSHCQRREFEAGQQLWEWIAAAASAAGDTLAAARARHRLAALMVARGSRTRQAARMLDGCLPAFSLAGDKWAMASTHYLLALCGLWDDDPEPAYRNAEQGLDEAQQAGDPRCVCLNMSVRGAVLAGIGRTEEGLSACNDALALATQLGDRECADAAGHMLARARLMVDRPPVLGRWPDKAWTAGRFPG